MQRGCGLGGILSGLLRSAVPLIKQGVKTLGRLALQTCVNIATDTLAGQNFKTSGKRRLKETGSRLGQQAVRKMPVSGKGGRKRKGNN